jgi:hypothetical protein
MRRMAEINITTQAEFDALPAKFDEFTYVYIRSSADVRIVIACAPESSHVEAWGSSHVEARESSRVVARGSVAVHVHSDYATVLLFAFACAFNLVKAKIQKKSKTATIIVPAQPKGTDGWLKSQAIKPTASVVLFKRVSADFKTQEGKPWETSWAIGAQLDHPSPDLKSNECGAGKYHACSRPYFCDEFRSEAGDRYIAIKIKKADMYAWPNPEHPHKIGFKAGTVLYEVNQFGEKLV